MNDLIEPTHQGVSSPVELITYAENCQRSGRSDLAIAAYRDWLATHDQDPLTHCLYFNLGVVLLDARDLANARTVFETVIGLQPDFYPPYINLGVTLEQLGLPAEAIACWQRLVDRLPTVTGENVGFCASALKQIARVGSQEEVEQALQRSLELQPYQNEAIVHWIGSRQGMCKWPVIVPFAHCDATHLKKGFAPLSLGVFTDDPMWQLANAAYYHRSEIGQPQPVYQDAHPALRRDPPLRPRIGYLSSDLRIHAIGYLMAEIFELHDRNKVEIFVYAVGPQLEDALKRRIQGAVEHWCDAHTLGDVELAERIVADRIEILVDVNGYTHSARTKMLAMRPAPVIVNWLGYPGTMGSPYHNYLIADDFLVPEALEFCYSERVMRLPCYQPNDRKRLVDPRRPRRDEVGLPAGVMVYGCFNSSKKISPLTWELWMQVLERVPASVLWLLREGEVARERLMAMAAQRGIAPERLIFAERKPNHEHMARYPLVDLMLDSTPYGAHTTASDALWMGVPILTMAGLSFPARVCASLVRSAGIGELVCATPEEFVARAVALGSDHALLASYRERLIAGRDHCVLFDTPLLVARLEELYFQMRADFHQDRVPRPDLTNLEVYQQIAIELDTDGVWFGTVERLTAAYMEKLIARDRLALLPEDHRLWSQAARERYAMRARPFLELLLEYDAADDLDGLIAFVGRPGHDPNEQLLAMAEGIAQGRMRAAFIVAMMLANQGYTHPVLSVALCLGGVLFHNPSEESRGRQNLLALLAALPAEQQSGVVSRVLVPAMDFLRGEGVRNADPWRVAQLLQLFETIRG
ncbi:MAG: hypothetical protein HQL91_03995 [Magnetococcales bacterium]|nr:hypothetical protein [Magnetococcales bacterium]